MALIMASALMLFANVKISKSLQRDYDSAYNSALEQNVFIYGLPRTNPLKVEVLENPPNNPSGENDGLAVYISVKNTSSQAEEVIYYLETAYRVPPKNWPAERVRVDGAEYKWGQKVSVSPNAEQIISAIFNHPPPVFASIRIARSVPR